MARVALVFEDHEDDEGNPVFSMKMEHDDLPDEDDERELSLAEHMAMVAHGSMVSYITSSIGDDELEDVSDQFRDQL